METQTIERQRGNRTADPASVVAYAGAAAFVITTTWFQTTNSIAFTIDSISQAFALAAFALIGAGMLAFAAAAQRHGHRRWVSYTLVAALAVLVTAGCYAADNDNLLDLAVLASGAVLPVWVIWASRIGGIGHPSPHAP